LDRDAFSGWNHRRNQALHEALFGLFYAAFAVELWAKDRSLLWAIPWLIFVPILVLGAINTYIENKKVTLRYGHLR
jgi:hypothetical protein